jgi:DNA-binding NarL/FixJ family response regulator
MLKHQSISAVIADDHFVVRDALRGALETPGLVVPEGIPVVAEAATGREALAEVKKHRPTILTLDISMPDISGHEIIYDLKKWSPETKIVVFTGIKAAGIIAGLIEGPIDGLFSKSGTGQYLYEKLPNILQGGRHIDDTFEKLLENQPVFPTLTPREHQVLNLIVSGHANKEIASVLGISIKTVEKHRSSVMTKLDVHSIGQLVAQALKHDLIDSTLEL